MKLKIYKITIVFHEILCVWVYLALLPDRKIGFLVRTPLNWMGLSAQETLELMSYKMESDAYTTMYETFLLYLL